MSLSAAPHVQSLAKPVIWTHETTRVVTLMPEQGIFLTGIEGSDPKVDGIRRNQLQEANDFYHNYETRLQNIRELGITWLRFGLPYSQTHIAKNRFDFTFSDKVIEKCKELGITIIVDLLHFGLPDWLHEQVQNYPFFQNPHFPKAFASYARAFAERYPDIRFYTIVNEPFVAAYLSAKLGMWNEHVTAEWHDDRAFVRAVANIAKATILSQEAIKAVWMEKKRSEELMFVQNESFEYAEAAPESGREAEAARFNLRRFAPLDLIFGHHDAAMEEYLISQELDPIQYEWFMQHGKSKQTILGIDHYPMCVHTFEKGQVIDHDPFMPYRLYDVVKEYWQRYPLPLLHTEVNAWPEHAITICQQTYEALYRLSREGYPILGMGWYGDDLQVGWHVALRGPQRYEESPVGLFYKGTKQPVADLFSRLAGKGFPLLASQKEVMPLLVLHSSLV